MKDIIIPNEDIEKLVSFFSLPKETKQKIFDIFNNIELGSLPSTVIEIISNTLNISYKEADELLSILFNIVTTKVRHEYEDAEYLDVLSRAITSQEDLQIAPEQIIKELSESGILTSDNLFASIEALEVLTNNNKSYVSAKIINNIRPVFNKGKNIGFVAVHDLKIKFNKKEDGTDFVFISLDSDDLADLKEAIIEAENEMENLNLDSINLIKIK